MNELIDRVARVLMEGMRPTHGLGSELSWDTIGKFSKEIFRGDAKRVISAMRDPTPEMIEGGAVFLIEHNPKEPIQPFSFWQAMIDEALE